MSLAAANPSISIRRFLAASLSTSGTMFLPTLTNFSSLRVFLGISCRYRIRQRPILLSIVHKSRGSKSRMLTSSLMMRSRLIDARLLNPYPYRILSSQSTCLAVMPGFVHVTLAVVGLTIGGHKYAFGVDTIRIDYILTEQLLLRREAMFVLYSCHR